MAPEGRHHRPRAVAFLMGFNLAGGRTAAVVDRRRRHPGGDRAFDPAGPVLQRARAERRAGAGAPRPGRSGHHAGAAAGQGRAGARRPAPGELPAARGEGLPDRRLRRPQGRPAAGGRDATGGQRQPLRDAGRPGPRLACAWRRRAGRRTTTPWACSSGATRSQRAGGDNRYFGRLDFGRVDGRCSSARPSTPAAGPPPAGCTSPRPTGRRPGRKLLEADRGRYAAGAQAHAQRRRAGRAADAGRGGAGRGGQAAAAALLVSLPERGLAGRAAGGRGSRPGT